MLEKELTKVVYCYRLDLEVDDYRPMDCSPLNVSFYEE